MNDITDKQVCEAYIESARPLAQWPYNILERITGQPEKVCFSAMKKAERRGLIEGGASLRSCNLTDKGKALTETLKKHSG